MKRIVRERPLTTDEAADDQTLREQVAADLPELLAQYEALLMVPKTDQISDARHKVKQ